MTKDKNVKSACEESDEKGKSREGRQDIGRGKRYIIRQKVKETESILSFAKSKMSISDIEFIAGILQASPDQ